MKAYNVEQPLIQHSLSDLMDWRNMQNAWMQQSNKAIGQIGNRMNSNLMANARAGGFGGGNLPAFLQAGIARNSRAVGGMQGNAFLQSLFNAKNMQLQGTSLAQQYRPLQTGQNTTETTSGLGTWLPQVVSGGIGAATAFIPGMNSFMKSGGTQSSSSSGWAGTPSYANPYSIFPSQQINPFGMPYGGH